jgi:hypothetical protein
MPVFCAVTPITLADIPGIFLRGLLASAVSMHDRADSFGGFIQMIV